MSQIKQASQAQVSARRALSIPTLTALACVLATCYARAETAETVVVTGTLIRGTNPIGAPVLGVTRADIEKSGASTTVDLLRQLPQISNLGADEGHTNPAQNANQNVTVGSGINLRGLGPESTLTLLNGRRMAPGGVAGQYTDPSSIPPLAIERLEVLTDGASATYGSDAVGGVVNMRLRSNFTGTDGMVRYGAAKNIHQKQTGLIIGRQWESGSVMFAADFNVRSQLSADNRNFYTDDMRAFGGPDLRGTVANPGNVIIGTTRYAIPAGQTGVGLAPSKLVAGTTNLQSITKGISALPSQERGSAVLSLTQEINDKVSLTLEGFFTERRFTRNLAAFSGNYTVRNTNPYFVTPVAGTTSETVAYSFFNDMGNAISTGFERSQQMAAIVNFELPGKWNGSAYLTNSVTQERNMSPAINNNAVNTALADTNAATSLNLFCDGAAFACNNPATLAKFAAFNDRNSKYTLNDLAFKADGPLFAMPAGLVRMAVGAEYHEDKLPYFLVSNNTGANTSIVKTVDNAYAKPARNVKSLFAETYVPLVAPAAGIPGVQRLDLSIAARTERYSDFGSTSNPKLGISWQPLGGVEVRSTYSKAFRAPTLGDTDPVNGSAVNVVTYIDADGKTSVRGINYLGGNPNGLKPETATIVTLGLGFKPADGLGASASLDYFNIDYKDRILTPGNDTTALQRPELASYVNRAPTAAQVQAAIDNPVYSGSATEPIAGIKFIVDGRRQNAGVVKMSGFDFSARYVVNAGGGLLTTGLSGTYLMQYKQQFTPTTALVDGLLNTLNNPLRFRARAEISWSGGAFSATSFINYTNAYRNTTIATAPTVAAYTTVDLNARYELGKSIDQAWAKGLSLTVSAQNLLDQKPPFVQNGTLAVDAQNVSAIGRFAALTVGKSW